MVGILIMNKVIKLNNIKYIKERFKGKKIGLCHGSFDLLHIGHLNHFEEAKKKVDILIVSVTADKYINKGEGRPVNNENKRLEFLKHVENIDYLYLDNSPNSVKIINKLKPDFYFKGIDYKNKDIAGNLKEEITATKKNKGSFFTTKSKKLSSTKIFQYHYSDLDKKKINVIKNISKNYGLEKIQSILNKLKKKEITIVGEPIIDEYVFCKILGLTSKDPSISSIIVKKEIYLGGVISNAITASMFVGKVNLITYGHNKHYKKLKKFKNIKLINISDKKEIQTKTRYLNENRFEKLLQITNFKSNLFSSTEKNKLLKIIKTTKSNLIISDYGIGLFDKEIVSQINKLKIKKYLNVQTNSMNNGLNLFTKYDNFYYMCLDEREWGMGLKKDNVNDLDIIKILNSTKQNYSFTKGKMGSSLYLNNELYNSPAYTKKIIDVTGCGDAYFVISSILINNKIKGDLSIFLSNLYAAMYSGFVANSETIDKNKFLIYIRNLIGD